MFVKISICDLKFNCIHIKIVVSILIKEKNIMGKHGLLKVVVTAAAVGGVCYAFRDKIKETKVYKSLDVEDKVEKAKRTIKEKTAEKKDDDRDYFTLNEDGQENENPEDCAACEEVAAENEAPEDITAKVNDLLSDIPKIKITESDEAEDITEDATASDSEESPLVYENEGLSDSSDDFDVLDEQDKLDI